MVKMNSLTGTPVAAKERCLGSVKRTGVVPRLRRKNNDGQTPSTQRPVAAAIGTLS
jgi:hypothetical protein